MARTLILAGAIIGGLLLQAAALNLEWWVPYEDECSWEQSA